MEKALRVLAALFLSLPCISQNVKGYAINEEAPNQVYVTTNPDENGNSWTLLGNAEIHTFRNMDIISIGNFLYITGTQELNPPNSGHQSKLYRYDLSNPTQPAELINTYGTLQGDQGTYPLWLTVGLALDFDGNLFVLGNSYRSNDDPILFVIDPSSGAIKKGFFGGDDYRTLTMAPGVVGNLTFRDHEDLAISSCDGKVFASLSILNGPAGGGRRDYISEVDIATGEVNPITDVSGNTDGLSFGGPNNTLFSSNGNNTYLVNQSDGSLTQLDVVGMDLDLEGLDFEIPRPAVLFSDSRSLNCGDNTTVPVFDNDVDPNNLLDFSTLTLTNVPNGYTVVQSPDNMEFTITSNESFNGTELDTIEYSIVSQSYGCVEEKVLTGQIIVETTCNDNLPVELIDFTANRDGKNVILTWSTASEEHNKAFEIQRSFDGQIWEKLSVVPGQGTSLETTNYEYTDDNTTHIHDKLYYRLKQMDYDGTYVYSSIAEIVLTVGEENFFMYPNPAGQDINVKGRDIFQIRVFDLNGKLWINNSYESVEKINLNVQQLHSGIYQILINEEVNKKLVIK